MKTEIDSAVTETLLYHDRTKHHFHRYARSIGFLDWANQPNPFRFYEGVTAVRLPLLQKDLASEHLALYGAATPSRILPAKISATCLSPNSEVDPGLEHVAQVSNLRPMGLFHAPGMTGGPPTWKSATQQVWKPALQAWPRPTSEFGLSYRSGFRRGSPEQ